MLFKREKNLPTKETTMNKDLYMDTRHDIDTKVLIMII